ncbi:hypothetical protein ACSSS7_001388 [Eimeria intestinalis]
MDASQFDFGLQLDTARLQEFLGKLCRSQEESQERQKELTTTLEIALKRLDKRDQDFEEQRQALQRLQEDVSKLVARYDDLEKLRIPEKVERFDNHHNDFKNLQAQLAQLDTKVERRQDELAASVQNKYDNLWRGVEHSLETISTAELKKYHHDIRAVSGEIEKRMNMQISYCLDILARATETNRRRDLKRAVILRWREQAWLASRRKVGLMRLVKCIHAPVRNCFRRWLFHVRWTCEVERVKCECKSLIPDLHALLAGSVNPRLQSLEHGVETEARKTNLLAERNQELWDQLQAVTVTCELENHARFRQAAEQRVQDAEGLVAQLSEQLTLVAREGQPAYASKFKHNERLPVGGLHVFLCFRKKPALSPQRFISERRQEDSCLRIGLFLHSDDVKNMMKDILLIWTSVKQLDAAKADRKEVDNLGAEVHNNCQAVSENLAKLELHNSGQESALDQRLSALQSAFDQSDSKCKELEFMLGLVVKLLEEIANAQISSMHQARRVTGGRLGSGRLDARLNLRATPCPAYDSELFSEPIRSARSLHGGQQSAVPEPDREKVASSIQRRPLHPQAATAKTAQPLTPIQGEADSAGKKLVRRAQYVFPRVDSTSPSNNLSPSSAKCPGYRRPDTSRGPSLTLSQRLLKIEVKLRSSNIQHFS